MTSLCDPLRGWHVPVAKSGCAANGEQFFMECEAPADGAYANGKLAFQWDGPTANSNDPLGVYNIFDSALANSTTQWDFSGKRALQCRTESTAWSTVPSATARTANRSTPLH